MTERLAIDGGTPVRTAPFPAWPVFDEADEHRLLAVLRSGDWGELTGQQVETFAHRFAEFQGAAYAVCVPNGTLALELALTALDIGPGDEVITTPYTFIATPGAVLTVGAKPVFVDIDPRTFNLDPAGIEAAITPRTKVILPVHLGGQPADMDGVLEVARRHNLRVVEDACQAWGARWRDRGVGTLGDLGAFSFQASKNITAGEGGAIVTNDRALYERCWSLHNVGRVPGGAWYQHEILGRNLRLPEWEGAILLGQLARLPAQAARRDANARYLSGEILEKVEGVTPEAVDPRVTAHAHHLFQMRYEAAAFGGHRRDDVIAALRAEGITPTTAGYVPLTHSPAIRQAMTARCGPEAVAALAVCPEAERAGEEIVWLQQTALLGERPDMDDIVEAFRKIQRAWG